MPDVFTKAKRSQVMSRIRGRGNKDTEVALAKLLRAAHISGWRRQVQLRSAECGIRNGRAHGVTRSTARVRPDFTFLRERVVIFVDGCFWHCCPKHSNMPAQNRAFWREKLTGNRTRDRLVMRMLRESGWRVIRIWEHELRKPARVVTRIAAALSRE